MYLNISGPKRKQGPRDYGTQAAAFTTPTLTIVTFHPCQSLLKLTNQFIHSTSLNKREKTNAFPLKLSPQKEV